MTLMFNNALKYNKQKPVLIKEIKALQHFYDQKFKTIEAKLDRKELSDVMIKQ